MSTTITGVVTNGVIVPSSPLPEGARVEIYLNDPLEIPPDLQVELAAWQQGCRRGSPWWNDWPTKGKPMKRGEVWRVRFSCNRISTMA